MKRTLIACLILVMLCFVHAPLGTGAEKSNRGRESKEVETFSSLDPSSSRADEEVFPPGLIKFEDAELLQVLKVYSDLSKRAIIRASSLPQTKISFENPLPLTRREALQSLDSVLAQNSITTIPQGTKFIKVVAAAQAPTEAAPVIDWPADELPDSGTYIQYIVELKHALPRDVVPALQPLAKMPQSIIAIDSNSLLVLRDYSSNVRRMMQMLAKLDKPPKREFGSSRK
jgi:type II secretory pathway component GspD/PulD (secretin)